MRFLIVNTDYPEFLRDLYARTPGLAERSYSEQLQARYDSLFSLADFYSRNLRLLGHDAWDVYLNNEPMQRAWARDHGLRLRRRTGLRFVLRRGVIPWVRLDRDSRWYSDVFWAQVEHYRPDVLINHNLFTVGDDLIAAVRHKVPVIVAQHAATKPPNGRDWGLYDLFLSSFPPTVEYFSRQGRKSAFLALGFEPRVLDAVGAQDATIPVSFVGSLHSVHASRAALLEHVANNCGLEIWTSSVHSTTNRPCLAAAIRGSAWGLDMYRTLARSKVTLNHHGDIGPYANNLRLFEATGVGALLITDWKPNLAEYFEVGTEVIAYRDAADCVKQIRHYLEHEDERAAIAKAGQRRTLRDHTWASRMKDLVSLLERCG